MPLAQPPAKKPFPTNAELDAWLSDCQNLLVQVSQYTAGVHNNRHQVLDAFDQLSELATDIFNDLSERDFDSEVA